MSVLDRQKAAVLIRSEMEQYHAQRRAGDNGVAWHALERAHIIAQPFLMPHLASHWNMLGFALRQRDGREAMGQLFRLALVPLGAMTGRLPVGNTGRARVSAFQPMPVPADLAVLISPPEKPGQR